MNPHQRVSTTEGATLREIIESSLQLFITTVSQLNQITLDNWSPPVCQVSLYSLVRMTLIDQALRIFAALFLLLIFFLRHFQRWFPRFFQARELLFIFYLPWTAVSQRFPVAGPSGISVSFFNETFEPEASGLEGQRYILAKPRAHSPNNDSCNINLYTEHVGLLILRYS